MSVYIYILCIYIYIYILAMMSHDCWSLIHLFMAQSVTIWLPLWCPPGRASRRDWRYPGFGRTATRSTTEALNFHWILDSETPQDTSSIPLRGRGRKSKDTPWYNYSKIEQLFNGWLPRKGNAPWKDWGLSRQVTPSWSSMAPKFMLAILRCKHWREQPQQQQEQEQQPHKPTQLQQPQQPQQQP